MGDMRDEKSNLWGNVVMSSAPWVTYRAASLWQTTPVSVMTSLSLSSRWTLPCKAQGQCHRQTRLVGNLQPFQWLALVPEGAKPRLRHEESGYSPLALYWLRHNGLKSIQKGHMDTWPPEVLHMHMSRVCCSETQ